MAAINVRVTPRASSSVITKFEGGVLHVRVTAPPAEGEANAAVTKLLASTFGLPARDVALLSGVSSRLKRFELPLSESEIAELVVAALRRKR